MTSEDEFEFKNNRGNKQSGKKSEDAAAQKVKMQKVKFEGHLNDKTKIKQGIAAGKYFEGVLRVN